MAPPLGQQLFLAIDPGYRTGCKGGVAWTHKGKLLSNTVIYPNQSAARSQEAGKVILDLTEKFHIKAIANR